MVSSGRYGTSITETPADTDLSVTNTAEYIPAALYSLISNKPE